MAEKDRCVTGREWPWQVRGAVLGVSCSPFSMTVMVVTSIEERVSPHAMVVFGVQCQDGEGSGVGRMWWWADESTSFSAPSSATKTDNPSSANKTDSVFHKTQEDGVGGILC